MRRNIIVISIMNNDTEHNYNDTEHNDTKHNDNGNEQNDTQYEDIHYTYISTKVY
jgi:hypothetical protein